MSTHFATAPDYNLETRFESSDLRRTEASGQRAPPEAAEEGVPDNQMSNITSVEPVPPDGGYGWVCTFAVFLINAHTWGVSSVSSQKPLITSYLA